MRLTVSDQWTLARMESELRKSDPKLAGMLAVFSYVSRHECGSGSERLSAWRPRLSLVVGALLLAAGICFFMVCRVVLRHDHRMGAAVPGAEPRLIASRGHFRGTGQRS